MKRTIFILALLFGVQSASANYVFFDKVRKTCAAYRVDINKNDMSLSEDEFTLTMTSMRNNFEMVMLIGFASVGKAIKHQRYLQDQRPGYKAVIPPVINIIVNIPASREDMIISASANSDLVIGLIDGTIDTAKFMREISESIQTL